MYSYNEWCVILYANLFHFFIFQSTEGLCRSVWQTLEVECRLLKILFSQFHPDVTSLANLGSYLLVRQPAHPTVSELVRIALTIAVTSTESERSFSTMKRIKTRLRTRMTEDRLSDLSILSIDNEIAQELQDDSIIDEFAASDKNRHIVLF